MSPDEGLQQLIERLGREELNLVRGLASDLLSGDLGSRTDLFSLVQELDDEQVAKLLDVARVMAQPIQENLNPKSSLMTPGFVAEFRARLQAHHATHTTPMDRLGFENAFLAASRAAGLKTLDAPSRTTRFFDATVDGKQVALKTEGAKAMKPDYLHISKLSEAAWVQDMRSARTRHEKAMAFIDEFLAAVQQIFVLRYYRSSATPRYELVEVPVALFEQIKNATVADFDSDAPRIEVADDKGPIMVFAIDRSDSKITVRKLVKARCVVHGEWQLSGTDEEK